MDFIFNIIFIVVAVSLAGAAFALMIGNIKSINEDMSKPRTKVKLPAPHPEMEGVNFGEELMSVNFQEQDEEDGDPLYKSLQDRINELNDDIDEDDDEEDDGGDLVVIRK